VAVSGGSSTATTITLTSMSNSNCMLAAMVDATQATVGAAAQAPTSTCSRAARWGHRHGPSLHLISVRRNTASMLHVPCLATPRYPPADPHGYPGVAGHPLPRLPSTGGARGLAHDGVGWLSIAQALGLACTSSWLSTMLSDSMMQRHHSPPTPQPAPSCGACLPASTPLQPLPWLPGC
jgi:hypothetical protein